MAEMDELEWIQEWYRGNCDRTWEKLNGVSIKCFDNPGWGVEIDLKETRWSGLTHAAIKMEKGRHDWMVCHIEKETFKGAGDPGKLKAILATFREWIETAG